MNRRTFLAAGLAAATPLARAGFRHPLGFQIFSVRFAAAKDFPGTLRRVEAFGYKEVELVSFHGYSGSDARNGFGPLAPLAPAEIGRIIRDSGLTASAAHFKLEEFQENRALEWAAGAGVRRMIVSDVPAAADMSAWKRIFEDLQHASEKVQKAGMRLGYHTHFDSWKILDGVRVMDALLATVAPGQLDVQLDVSTTQSRGVDPAAFLREHGRRVFSMHLRDGRKPAQPGAYVYALPLGTGDLAWPEILAASEEAGIRNYVVEMAMEASADPFDALRSSAQYLRGLS